MAGVWLERVTLPLSFEIALTFSDSFINSTCLGHGTHPNVTLRYDVEMELNHAMIYSKDVARALSFYRDLLGFTLLEEFRGGDRLVYARLKPPNGTATIALHLLVPGETLHAGGIRLYFEIKDLEKVCKKLEAAGARFSKPPATMPWGWKHAYLDDPDGHEISLYWAGAQRLKKATPAKKKPAKKHGMTPADFRRIALSMAGAEEGSHMGAADFRVGGRIFATLGSQDQGYGNLMINLELQAEFIAGAPDVFLPIKGGWGRMGMTHIRLAKASEDVLAGALTTSYKLRVQKNLTADGKKRKK